MVKIVQYIRTTLVYKLDKFMHKAAQNYIQRAPKLLAEEQTNTILETTLNSKASLPMGWATLKGEKLTLRL